MNVRAFPLLALAVLALLPQAITGQIYSASASHMAGALGLSLDEASGFKTLNMIAQLTMLPLASWLAYRWGDRVLLRLGALIGLVSALVSSLWMLPLPQLIAWAGHGVSASFLLLLAHRIVLTQLGFRAIAFVEGVMLLTVVLLPMSLYPYLLAHLAEEGGWHWAFAVQVMPFLLMLYWARCGRWPCPDKREVIGFNWLQALLVTGFIAGSAWLLLRGERYNWFRDPDIVVLALVTAVLGCLSVLAFRYRWGRGEYIRTAVMADPHGKVGMLDAAVAGFMILGITLLIGNFVVGVMAYSHEELGKLDLISLPGMLAGLAVALLMTSHPRRDPEQVVPLGVMLVLVTAVLLTGRTAGSGVADLWLPLLIKGLAIGLLNVSITIHILRKFPRAQAAEGVAWFYLFRTFGSLLAITQFSRLMTLESQSALSALGENFNAASESFLQYQQQAGAALQQMTGQAMPEQVAALLGQQLKTQALSVAGLNNFQWLIFTMAMLVPVMVASLKWANRHPHPE